MNILRQLANLFVGKAPVSGDIGIYYYMRCNRCGEVIRVRLNPMNDLSHSEDGKGYFAHKVIVGQRCYNRIEADFEFDSNRKLSDKNITGGTLVDQAAYDEDQQANANKQAS